MLLHFAHSRQACILVAPNAVMQAQMLSLPHIVAARKLFIHPSQMMANCSLQHAFKYCKLPPSPRLQLQPTAAVYTCTPEDVTGVNQVRHTRPSPGQPKEVGEEAMAPAMTSGYRIRN